MTRPTLTNTDALGPSRPFDDTRPKGVQIRERLEDLALALGPGEPIPSDRQLADYFGVARMTVRREVSVLVADGILETRRGSGTFVANDPPRPHEWGASYSLHAAAGAQSPGSKLLARSVIPLSARWAAQLGVAQGSNGLHLMRLRTLDGEPVGIEDVYLPLERFPGLEDVNLEVESLYATLERRWGLRRVESAGIASAVLPTEEQAILLGVAPTQPCMVVRMVSSDEQGVPFEAGRATYRGDRYELAVTHRAPLASPS